MENVHLFFHRQQLNHKGTSKGLLVTDRAVSPILLTQRDRAEKASYEISWEKSLLGERTLFLNAEQDDPSLMRRRLAYCFFDQIGVPAPAASYSFLSINGQPEGIYLSIRNHHLVHRADCLLKTVDPRVPLSIFKEEASAFSHEFRTLICTAEDDELADRIKMYLDVKRFFLWLIGSACTSQGFYYAFCANESGRLLVTPMETRALAAPVRSDEDPLLTKGRTLAARLLSIPAFRSQYHTLMKNVLNRSFTIERLAPFISDWLFDICQKSDDDPFIKKSPSQFEKEQTNILREIEERQDCLQAHLARL
ncbi:CotH kinase family protein [Bacillus tequilensis]|uniref:Spore coat protein n=1 Tax=Bacillus tequilensis TaxID=227866 RepID=A0A6H0WH82_9BACI|nr:CotH kinase family protein [Bacillus tequilensis]QIW79319.1 spore coat protein [Bacillus tequilensis]